VQDETGYFLENSLLFTRILRGAGLPISTEQGRDFAQALTMVDIGERDQVFYTARSLLVTRQEHLRLFETIFNRFWRVQSDAGQSTGHKAPTTPRQKRSKRFDIISYMSYMAQPADEEIEVSDKSGTFSSLEVLQRKEFSEMTPEELETIKQLIQEMSWQVILRRTRRRVPDPNGSRIHLRRALRSTMKYGGVPIELFWQSRKYKQRPFVLIADISGSMEQYARLILQLFYSVSHKLNDVECFVFGTRLTRITSQLKLKNIDRAISEASHEIVDWSGGTRIGESLQTFNHRWGRRVLRRGAIVIIVSDGWERGDVSILRREMHHLQRRCYRLIWLNPLSGKSTYQPLAEGMAAALPAVDDFLPIHNLQSLKALSEHLSRLETGRPAKPSMKTLTPASTQVTYRK
jgi:uncharacterized protein with von Willebrand factor type A (vWA) domain